MDLSPFFGLAWRVMSESSNRIGLGYDLHRLEEGRPLIIGGVKIPSERGAVAHSDGDVVLHALVDALLGAAALGDRSFFGPAGNGSVPFFWVSMAGDVGILQPYRTWL